MVIILIKHSNCDATKAFKSYNNGKYSSHLQMEDDPNHNFFMEGGLNKLHLTEDDLNKIHNPIFLVEERLLH